MSTPRTHALDVRSVEPKHRLDTILNAWKSLNPGDDLNLKVDHDPKCMYYTLAVDYGEDAFSFEYIENGPLTWEVKVLRKK